MKPLILAAVLLAPVLPQQRIQTGVIAGQVRNLDGSAAVGIRVAALLVTEGVGQGGATMVSALAQTNETGRYRLEGVYPGRYYVIAGFIDFPTYYPGVKGIGESRIVTVDPGSSVASIDFALARPTGIRVSGQVKGVPADLPSGVFRVVLLPSTTPILSTTDVAVESNGSFEFLKVPPGRYTVRLTPTVPAPAATMPTIEVDDKDITTIELVAPPILLGRVTVEGGGSIPVQAAAVAAGVINPPGLLRLTARRLDASGTSTAIIRSDGVLVWPLQTGEYQVAVSMSPIGYYVTEISSGTVDLLRNSLKVAEASTPEIRVTLSRTPPLGASRGVSVSGRVTGLKPEELTVPRWVTMQASTPSINSASGIAESRIGETLLRPDGTFEISGVPPGSYTIRVIPTSGPVPIQRLVVADRDVRDVELSALSTANPGTAINSILGTGGVTVVGPGFLPPPPPPPPPVR